jgi:hypothetical protein
MSRTSGLVTAIWALGSPATPANPSGGRCGSLLWRNRSPRQVDPSCSAPRTPRAWSVRQVWPPARAEELAAVCKAIGKQIKPLLPYATAVEFERVRDGDLLQMLWYVCKTPYKQYQVWQGENSLRQWKRDLNGVNSVRLYAELRNATLDQLTLAGGEGRAFLKALRRDIQGWQQNARAKGYI